MGVGEGELLHGVLPHRGRAAEGWRRRCGVGNGGALELALAGEVEGLAKLSASFALDTMVYSIEDSVDDLVGCVLGLCARLVDASADED